MAAQTKRYEITDEEWERIKGYFPERAEGQKGRPRAEDRMLFNGILWIARSGAAWRDLPERFGPWNTVYKRFAQWQESGLFEKIFKDLAIDADLQDMSLDSTSIKAHQSSAGAKKGT
jgi:transposase